MLLATVFAVWSVAVFPPASAADLRSAQYESGGRAAALRNDPRVEWLAGHATRLRSIEPNDDDFRDLEPLRAKLKGVRIVLLGEQSHGDGTTFLAKTRLIRFLHEQLGFDVLVFESGLYDCAKAWERLAAGEDARTAVPRGVFAIWTRSAEVQPLIDYLGQRAKSERPLELAGADMQFTGTASSDSLIEDLAAQLSSVDPKLTVGEDWQRVTKVIRNLGRGAWELGTEPVPSPEEQAAFARTLARWRSMNVSPFWRQFLISFQTHAEQTWRTDYSHHAGNAAVFAMRDRQMGENLLWLARQRYPKRKLIVWGATFHNARRLGTLDPFDPKLARLYSAMTPMGEVAWKALGGEVYSIAFTSFQGESATVFARSVANIPPPSRGSLEDLFNRAGLENAFVDFRKAPRWLRSPLIARLMGHTDMRGDWTRVVDGVVFLKTMRRSTRVTESRGRSSGSSSVSAAALRGG